MRAPESIATRRRLDGLVLLPVACLLGTLLLGLVVGVKAVKPDLLMNLLPMQMLQPLHAFMGVAFVLTGLCAGVVIVLRRLSGDFAGARFVLPTLLVFVIGSAASIALGRGSGVEYVGWPLALTLLIGAVFIALTVIVLARIRQLSAVSPEGAWLVALGLLLVALGLGERSAEIVATPGMTRALTIEWHALDTFFAGWNAALYGLGMLAICRPGDRGRPLRARWLFVLAAFCLLSTFGHHHYMSPQPTLLKAIAVTASMLAGVSFVRHVWAILLSQGNEHSGHPEHEFFHAAELFTLAAIGSGVFLAVPQINVVLHGTLAIVAHSMGSMIGVNVMIILGIMVRYSDRVDAEWTARLTKRVRWAGAALMLLCLNLLAAGAVEGVLRMSRTFQEYDPVVRMWLVPLPLLGLGLAVAMGLLVREVLSRPRGRVDEPRFDQQAEVRGVIEMKPEQTEPSELKAEVGVGV